MAKTCCQHSYGGGGVQREKGRTTESNQATNKCNKYDDKGSKKQQYEEAGLEEDVWGGGGVVGARTLGSQPTKSQPQKATSKRLPKNSIT